MKTPNAMTKKRRPPRTGATSAPPSGRAAPPAPPPAGASATLWILRPPAQSALPASPSALPAPWERNATESPAPHSSPTLPPSSRGWMQNCAIPKPHSKSQTCCGVHNSAPLRHTLQPLQFHSWNPQHSIINNTVPFLGSRIQNLCPGVALGLAWVQEANNRPLSCHGARGFRKPGLLPSGWGS